MKKEITLFFLTIIFGAVVLANSELEDFDPQCVLNIKIDESHLMNTFLNAFDTCVQRVGENSGGGYAGHWDNQSWAQPTGETSYSSFTKRDCAEDIVPSLVKLASLRFSQIGSDVANYLYEIKNCPSAHREVGPLMYLFPKGVVRTSCVVNKISTVREFIENKNFTLQIATRECRQVLKEGSFQ